MKFILPEKSKNRLIKAANLLKRGFAKWEKLPKTTRNITAGVSFLVSGILIPKGVFILLISSIYAGRHVYLSGEMREAANEIVIEKESCSSDCCSSEDLGHL